MRKLPLIVSVFAAASLMTTGFAFAKHRHHHMLMSAAYGHSASVAGNGGHRRDVFYGVGDGGATPRTTATGGNSGGYSNRN